MVYLGSYYFDKLSSIAKSLILSFTQNPLQSYIEREFADEREGTLSVRDDRTGKHYTIPIVHNAIPAVGFRQICAKKCKNVREQYENGLRIIDPGYRNTAVKMSQITYMYVRIGSFENKIYN